MSILYPVFVLVALTAVTVLRLAVGRLRAVQRGEVPLDYYRTYRDGREPDRLRVLSRHYDNLLQAPVLFYVAALAVLATGTETALTVGLAWAYAALRVVHSVVHTTRNDVPSRFRVFALSWVVLVALWIVVVAVAA